MVKVITGVIKKDNQTFVSFSIRGFFAWVHRGLTILENWILKKLEAIGKKQGKRLVERTSEPEMTSGVILS